MYNVNEWTIRMWANRFDILNPRRNEIGEIIFSPADVKIIGTICSLTKVKDATIEYVREYLELGFKQETQPFPSSTLPLPIL
jgi:DNA-binding transcriptional MerR regulator